MDKKVPHVASSVLTQVVLQIGDGFAFVRLPLFGGKRRQSARVLAQFLWNLAHRLGDDRLLLVLLAVGDGLLLGQRAELERNRQLVSLLVPSQLIQARQEEALFTLDVVLLHIGGFQFKVHGHAFRRFPGVIGEILASLDVVLVMISPIDIDLLAVIGNGVAFFFGVAPLEDKVAVLIVAAKESVQVIVDGGLQRFKAFGGFCPLTRSQVLLAHFGITVTLG